MKKLAKEEKLEQAIELRNKLKKLKRVFENAQIIAKLKTNSFPTLSRIHDKIETKPKESKTLKQLAREIIKRVNAEFPTVYKNYGLNSR